MAVRKRHIAVILGTALIVLGGLDFLSFCKRAAALPVPAAPSADAIITLTGGSGLRIAAGIKLVETGAADHLLISGVNPNVTMVEIAALAGGPPSIYECCVELGYQAETTIGNAIEAANWARENEYTSLIIVTSSYHMPRSLIVLGRTMPDISLQPYPVQSRIDPGSPLSSWNVFKGLGAEWAKWRVMRLRYGQMKDTPTP